MTATTPRRLLGVICGHALLDGSTCEGTIDVLGYRDPLHPRIRLVVERCASCGRQGLPERAKDWRYRHARQHAARAAARGEGA